MTFDPPRLPRAVVALSKAKLAMLVVFALLFVAAGVWMFGLDAAEIAARRRFNTPWIVHGLGLAGIVFGAIGALAIGKRALDPGPGLVLDERGLTDNSSAVGNGFLPWADIAGFEVRTLNRQRMLYVMLHDPQRFLAGRSGWRRWLHRLNMGLAPSPVALAPQTLAIKFDDLLALLERHLAAARARP